MHGDYDSSIRNKLILHMIHAFSIGISAWLLIFRGYTVFPFLNPADITMTLRHYIVFAAVSVYFLRVIGTTLLLKRKMAMDEILTVGIFALFFENYFSILSLHNSFPIDFVDILALLLYICGSILNSGSELMRFYWKKHPENKGKLYTKGFFRISMYPNYSGDLVLFSGLALLTRNGWAFIIPLVMILGFVFFNIPKLDSHLEQKYPEDYREYSRRTKKLIPFIY